MEANYLLDTNICISILKNKNNMRQKVAKVGLEHCFISEITLAELYYGASKSGLELQGARIDDFDLLIGATAVKHNYIMVSDNIKHLGRIPGIQITNWKE